MDCGGQESNSRNLFGAFLKQTSTKSAIRDRLF